MSQTRTSHLADQGTRDWQRIWSWSVLGSLLIALCAGGSPRYGSYTDVPLELASLPLIFFAVLRIAKQPLNRARIAAFAICAAVLVFPLIQLVPLPPALWTALPGRQFVLDVFEAARIDTPWMPLSLSPPATLRSFLSLFPPLAVFLAVLTLTHHERRIGTLIIIAFGIVSVVLGLAQLAAGPESSLRLYEVTNEASAVGFFANRNHYAALLYCVMPLTAAWMIHLVRGEGLQRWIAVAMTVVIYGALILGLGMAASRAGILLAMVAILTSLLLAWRTREHQKRRQASKWVFAAGLLGIFIVLQFGLAGILSRLDRDPLEDGRVIIAQVTLRAASSVFPIGSGIGTFIPYYAMFETVEDLGPAYINHAHNDWLELWMEGSVPALLIELAFLAWFCVMLFRTWRKGDGLDWLLARAASISAALLLLHSAVDYPLRTAALASFFAFACAAMLDLPKHQVRRSRGKPSKSAEEELLFMPESVGDAPAVPRNRSQSRPAFSAEPDSQPFSNKSGRFESRMD